jgi:hypothetical protein
MLGRADNIPAGNHAIDMSTETSNVSPRELLQSKIRLIEALNFSQLKQWVEARLRGKDAILADMAGNSRAYPLVAIYPKLKRTVREDLQRACLELLNEFVSAAGSGVHTRLQVCSGDGIIQVSQSL